MCNTYLYMWNCDFIMDMCICTCVVFIPVWVCTCVLWTCISINVTNACISVVYFLYICTACDVLYYYFISCVADSSWSFSLWALRSASGLHHSTDSLIITMFIVCLYGTNTSTGTYSAFGPSAQRSLTLFLKRGSAFKPSGLSAPPGRRAWRSALYR